MRNKKITIGTVIIRFVLLMVVFLMVYPFIWMLITAFKSEADIRSFPPVLFSGNYTLDNFENIWGRIPFLAFYKNTLVFAGGVTACSILFDSMSGYAFARLHFKGRNILFTLVLITLMIPFQVIMVPLYSELFHLKLLNSYAGLILPRATNAFGIFMMRQFFVSLPVGLEEAARIDGCTEFQIYRRIMMPLCKPAIVTLLIFHFMYNWNDLLYPLIIATRPNMKTLAAGLASFMGTHVVEYGILMAGSILSLLPILIAYCVAQKSFVQGIAMTGMKG
jgi:multiple sugar transport system permease protein